jgi:hypothetical protein
MRRHEPMELDVHPRWGMAWTIVSALISVAAAAVAVEMFRDMLRSSASAFVSGSFWFFLLAADIAILAGCAALRRFGVPFPTWLVAPLLFLGFTGGVADSLGDSFFSPSFARISFILLASATAIATLGAAAGQWQISRAVSQAMNGRGRYEIAIPRYPFAAICIALLIAEPGIALIVIEDDNLKAYALLAIMPIIALLGLWQLRIRPSATIVDAEGIENAAQLPGKICWHDLQAVRIVRTGMVYRDRTLQFIFKDARAVPKTDHDPTIPESASPPHSFAVSAIPFWIPAKPLVMLIRERIVRNDVGRARSQPVQPGPDRAQS